MITAGEAVLALIRDHVANRHLRRAWPGCPVCEHVKKLGS